MFKQLTHVLILLLIVFLCMPAAVHGGGLLYAFSPEIKGELFPLARLAIQSSENFVAVTDSSLDYSFSQTFINDNEFPLESAYILPIPEGVLKRDVEVLVDGTPTDFIIHDHKSLERILRDVAKRHHDHDVLELWGESAIVVRPIHLESRGKTSVRARFRTYRDLRKQLFNLKVTLIGERYSLGPVADFTVWAKFNMGQTIRSSISRTHAISVTRETPHRRLVCVRELDRKVSQDFELLTSLGGSDFDLRILNYQGSKDKNYFMLMVQPPLESVAGGAQSDMDVVFVLDSSGSIRADQLRVAKAVIMSGLERLKESERFNIISLGSGVRSFSPKLRNATVANREQAAIFMDGIVPGGGSDLFNGIVTAMESFSSRKRPGAIVLLSDGRPTVGFTNNETLIENLRRLNKYRARIYAVNIGDSPNTMLMDRLASHSNGKLISISFSESHSSIIDKIFSEIMTPTVTDISLDYQDVYVDEVFPETLTNINGNDCLVALGSYDKSSFMTGRIAAKAKIRGKTISASVSIASGEISGGSQWLETVWAMRKFAKLLEKEMFKPDSQSSDRISAIIRMYGFKDFVSSRSGLRYSGEKLWDLMTSLNPGSVMSSDHRFVNGRLFRLSDGAWVDSSIKPGAPVDYLNAFGDDFFNLLEKNPELAKYFSLGPRVSVSHSGRTVVTRGNF